MKSFISDFTQDDKCWCNNKDFYEKSIRTAFGSFSIVDYEAYENFQNIGQINIPDGVIQVLEELTTLIGRNSYMKFGGIENSFNNLYYCMPILILIYFSSISKLRELDYINEEAKPYEIKNLVRFAPKQSVKSIILPSRTNLVQELPTHTTEQTKLLFPIIICEHEISSWYCNGTKINGIDETLRGYNTLAWNSNTVEEKLVIALFSHCYDLHIFTISSYYQLKAITLMIDFKCESGIHRCPLMHSEINNLPSRKILVQEMPTHTTEQSIITYEHVAEISSWINRKLRT
ncbi:hypothetical protein Glove_229g80 [Diversispora epigaea]|uniref:Uncharacterized protein n=1 Tax=Diversispora epigaea TaxID=1348612 RepID=A0A397IFX0_9GLOM|nr:hypothetical protein Glove_229g80 [Diversispora epigaea]